MEHCYQCRDGQHSLCVGVPCECPCPPSGNEERPSGISPGRMADALTAYAEWCGGVHDDGCPEDDTCECSGQWINEGVNEAVRFLRAASVAGVRT